MTLDLFIASPSKLLIAGPNPTCCSVCTKHGCIPDNCEWKDRLFSDLCKERGVKYGVR